MSWTKSSCNSNTTKVQALPITYTKLVVPFLQPYGDATDNYFNEDVWITLRQVSSITWYNSNGSLRSVYILCIGY